MTATSKDHDLLVLGGGMAGLSAAAWAASQGARVALVEKAPHLGGTAALSGGYVWTAPTYACLRSLIPRGKGMTSAAGLPPPTTDPRADD